MSFKKWLEDSDKAFFDSLLNYSKVQGLKMTKDYGALIPTGLDEKTLKLFIAYRNQKTTKMLVLATWFLAIGTLFLSGLTLYFQYSKKG